MKEIPLTQGKVALVSDEDYEMLMQWKWCCHSQGYAVRAEGKRAILMHRVITRAPKGAVVDHINHDRLDNRRENLRVAGQSENMLNRKETVRSGFTSRFRGVSHRGGKSGIVKNDRGYIYSARKPWLAGYRGRYLGMSATEEEAAQLYDLAALRDKGARAQLNFPIGELL